MLSACRVICVAVAFSFGCDAITLRANSSASSVMLVAGASSPDEMCLTEQAGQVRLDSCASAVAAGDGREIWTFLSGGQLMNVVSKRCAGATVAGISLALSECTGASPWKMLPNGQVQVGEQKCLSQKGGGTGVENVAAHAAAAATSSASSPSHAAAAAVDADVATFWASRPGESGPIVLTVDLGEVRSLSLMKIAWEFPAQSFAVSVSADGEVWHEVFTTSVNMVKANRIPLGLIAAKSVKVEMRKSFPSIGMYGIKSLTLFSPRLEAALDDCATASSSQDARDKYFAVSVGLFDPTPSTMLHAKLPALVAAKIALSSTLSELASVGQKLPACQSASSALAATSHIEFAASSRRAASSSRRPSAGTDEVEDLVDIMVGVDAMGVNSLLEAARSEIVGMRDALVSSFSSVEVQALR